MYRLMGGLIAGLLVGVIGWTAGLHAEPFPGTKPLEVKGDADQFDWAWEMVTGIDKFLLDVTADSIEKRAAYWKRDTASAAAYNNSVAPNRQRLAKIIGAQDPRVAFEGLELLSTTEQPALVGRGEGFEVYAVRWPVLDGIQGEGLLLKPDRNTPLADVVALPDADHTPEMLAGLVPGVAAQEQFARRLAENGCRVVIPLLIDRASTHSTTQNGTVRSAQPHREFIYRQAYEMGRHLIGYEVQKVLALVDWFQRQAGPPAGSRGQAAVGVIGHGEGGLLALYAAALDPRIGVACTSGYFDSRQELWREPIYRNVFGLLHEFGDAELASLVAPRALIVEAARSPQAVGRAFQKDRQSESTPGRLVTPGLASVTSEVQRAANLVEGLQPGWIQWVASGDGGGPPGSDGALKKFLAALEPAARLAPSGGSPTNLRKSFDADARLKRQLQQMTEFTQALVRESPYTRAEYWSEADRKSRSVDHWRRTSEPYRQRFYNDVIGRFDRPLSAPNVRTRKLFEQPSYVGYEVVLDVFPNVIAYGRLLVPKDIKQGERRPVVVCQHGLEGRPSDVAEPGLDHSAYHDFACKLAERGFITYAPQNPYKFYDHFRNLQRKLNPLKKTLFSVIVPQHQQTVNWLASLPMVDGKRIGFYGLSYGGKSAMRIPALVTDYCLSICSADFNEWIWKNTSVRSRYSYMQTREYEMFEFDLGNTFNYAEMAALIAPRPFMVERGHRDGVAPDEWVAYEFAKVKLLYVDLQIGESAEIEFFDGPHTIHGVGSFDFLHRHLQWPAP